MTVTHPTLFDAPPTTGTARHHDPATSQAAADSISPALHVELRRGARDEIVWVAR